MENLEEAVVLKHGFGTRLFHWGLVLGFLPAAFTGIGLWLRPFGAQGMHYVMLIHMISSWILSAACVYFFIFQYKRVIAFWREVLTWSKKDFVWMKVGGGYPQKMFLGRDIEVPPMKKMNPGQKMMGIVIFFGSIVMIGSGMLLYFAMPLLPREMAFQLDQLHLVLGLALTMAVVFGHVVLGIYNWQEFVCMFGDGTMKVSEAMHHNELWVQECIEAVPAADWTPELAYHGEKG